MKLKDVPESSRTHAAARQAFGNEYMVPIESAWELETELAKAYADMDKLRVELAAKTKECCGSYDDYSDMFDKHQRVQIELKAERRINRVLMDILHVKSSGGDEE